MCLQPVIPRVVLIVLAFSSLAANRVNRKPARASRPIQTAALARTGFMIHRGKSAGDVQSLQQAYKILATANHDYQGHRIKAMKSIHAAAKLLGTNLRGDEKNKEPQQLSDEQIRGVQKMLQHVRGTVSGGRNQARIVGHVDQAIHHLGVALTIK